MGEGGVTPREDRGSREGIDRTAGHKPQVIFVQSSQYAHVNFKIERFQLLRLFASCHRVDALNKCTMVGFYREQGWSCVSVLS